MDLVQLDLVDRRIGRSTYQKKNGTENQTYRQVRRLSGKSCLIGMVAFLFLALIGGSQGIYAQSQQGDFDFGDAPGDQMTEMIAYEDGTSGFFPTYWDGWSPGTSLGPIHSGPAEIWLGGGITFEPLADPLTITQPDESDDGWLNREVPFRHCEIAVLEVKISQLENAPLPGQMYLNVWFDANRDGDWNDSISCNEGNLTGPVQAAGSEGVDPNPDTPPTGEAFAAEWIVKDYPIDTFRIEGESIILHVPTDLIPHKRPQAADEGELGSWVRFSLSEMKATPDPFTCIRDGRGPSIDPFILEPDMEGTCDGFFDDMIGNEEFNDEVAAAGEPLDLAVFEFGETEDFFRPMIPEDHRVEDDPEDEILSDLGDAPDSFNATGTDFLAYFPGTVGAYPTIWKDRIGGVSGPKHDNVTKVWLGEWGSVEVEADMGYDEDGSTNLLIHDDGSTVADLDSADDGWLNQGAEFHHCQETRLKVLVGADDTHELPDRMFLNVWFDGNRDGDWDDIAPCDDENLTFPSPNQLDGTVDQPFDSTIPHAFEWIVQNEEIDIHDVTDEGFYEVIVPTHLVLHFKPELGDNGFVDNAHVWTRFTLSDKPVQRVNDYDPPRADGRGPAYPDLFELGETEDYKWYPQFDEYEEPEEDEYPTSDLGDAPDSSRNHYGPMEVTAYHGRNVLGYFPTVYNVAANTPQDGPRGPIHHDAKVVWLGEWVSTEFEADEGFDEDGPNNILDDGYDRADADRADDGWLNYETAMPHCEEARIKVLIGKDTSRDQMPEAVYLNAWFDGDRNGEWEGMHECGMGQNGQMSMASEWIVQNHKIMLSDLPNDFSEVKLTTYLIPNLEPGAPAWVRFTLSEAPAPTNPNINMADGRGPEAGYRIGETEDYFREVYVDEIPEADLGDAPDSDNGLNLNNTAYWDIGQPGYFPTVWRDSEPSGPKHLNPFAVWLGPWVSAEAGAATGPDQDGMNNILDMGSDVADQDHYDDGWQNPYIWLPDCDTTKLEVKISKDMYMMAEELPDKMYLNVWLDGDRDGDWDDYRRCFNEASGTEELSFEWIVQDFEVDIANMTDDYVYIEVPTVLILNDHTTAVPNFDESTETPAGLEEDEEWPVPAFMRFTLSEIAAPMNPDTQYPDGRGPSFSEAYRIGETEDYLYWPPEEPIDDGPEIMIGDLGDAPDSEENKYGISNTAYHLADGTAIDGYFPTVWGGNGSGAISGPYHADTWTIYLGYDITYEEEADRGYDMDGSNNILRRGWDEADNDGGDDGWINQDWAVFPDCRETYLEVHVAGTAPPEHEFMYLNVWFDGNRNGQWGDTKPCELVDAPPIDEGADMPEPVVPASGAPTMDGPTAHEWVVQNFRFRVSDLDGDLPLHVPTTIVMNDMPRMPAWVRFTLSERPVDDSQRPFMHDGRGPQYPDMHIYGETEDYFYKPPFDLPDDNGTGELGNLALGKFATINDGFEDVEISTVEVGDRFWYNIELKHEGGTMDTDVELVDWLPEGLRITDGPDVRILGGSATPPIASVSRSFGTTQVEWRGNIYPDSKIQIRFEVEVENCPFNTDSTLENYVDAHMIYAPDRAAFAENRIFVECGFLEDAGQPELYLDKWIRVELADLPDLGSAGGINFEEIDDEFNPIDFETEFRNEFGEDFELDGEQFWFDPRFDYVEEHSISPGRDVFFQLVLSGYSPVRETVQISDTMPAGLEALEVSADRGIAEISNGVVTWRGQMDQRGEPVFIKIRARPNDKVFCETMIRNTAHWRMRSPDGTVLRGDSNEARLRIICRDLGDAPDSMNHFGEDMDAYPGVIAKFPTVHKLAEESELRGPMHQEAKPFHLGRGVSREREADIGGDADGVNNIMVFENRGNFDDYDDGVSRYDIAMTDCEKTTLKVIVAIDADSIEKLKVNEGIGYLNMWLDGNRDGDWDDIHECEGGIRSPEHIVIDHEIDAETLGAGIHELTVETTVPIHWPAEETERPAWARATLSERVSYKMLPDGCVADSCRFGDGRGYPDSAFALGETEDYLVRPFDPNGDIPTDGADPVVEKEGRLRIRHDPRDATVEEWLAEWKVEYSNAGYGLAESVIIEDTVDPHQEIVSYSTFPTRPVNPDGKTITVNGGDMAPGQTRYINMRSTVPLDTPPGTVLTNTVVISSANDALLDNNTVVVTMTIPLQPPIITYPLPGTTCTGTVTVVGRAQPGVFVDLYIDGVQVTNSDGNDTELLTDTVGAASTMGTSGNTLVADANGRWSFDTILVGDGEHTIFAVARTIDGVISQPSETVVAVVNSDLTWNPMSLRFRDSDGHVIIPRDEEGRIDETGWGVPLRPGVTYSVTVEICCDDPSRGVALTIPGVEDEVVLEESGVGNLFVGAFTTSEEGVAEGTLKICVTCGLKIACSDGTVLIDPEGTVFSLATGMPISGAEVICLERQQVGASSVDGSDALFSRWKAEDYNDQINPQIVGDDGYFSFFTPPGTFRLQVSKEGYYPYMSKDLVVVDEPVHFDVPLLPEIDLVQEDGEVVTLTIDENGFNPPLREVEPGTIVKWRNLDTDSHSATSTISKALSYEGSPTVISAAGITSTDAWDTGLIESGDEFIAKFGTEGTYTYYDANNPSNTATIVVTQGAEAPPADLNNVNVGDDTDVPDSGNGSDSGMQLFLPFTVD